MTIRARTMGRQTTEPGRLLLVGIAAQALWDVQRCSHRPGANGDRLAYLNEPVVRKCRIYRANHRGGRPNGAKGCKPRRRRRREKRG